MHFSMRRLAQTAPFLSLRIYIRVTIRLRLSNIEDSPAHNLQIGREILKFPFARAGNFNTHG